MKFKKLYIAVALCFLCSLGFSQQQEEKFTFMAKLLKYKLEQVDLTPAQWESFNELSRQVTTDVQNLRAEAGITDLIKKRDVVYRKIVKEGIPEDKQLAEIGKRLNLTPKQLKGFADTPALKAKYKKNVMKLLTEEQKVKLKTAKPKPKEQKKGKKKGGNKRKNKH